MGDTNERSCFLIFAWTVATLIFVVMLSLSFRVALPTLLGENQTSHTFDKTTQLNDGIVSIAGNTDPPVPTESTPTDSFDTRFVSRLEIENQLTPKDEELAPETTSITVDRPFVEANSSTLTTPMTSLDMEPELSLSTVHFGPFIPVFEDIPLLDEFIFKDLGDAFLLGDRSAYTIPNLEDVVPLPTDSKTAEATSTEPQQNNEVVVSADESALASTPIVEVVLLHDNPGVTFQMKQTSSGTTTITVTLPSFEVEVDEVTPEVSPTLERYEEVTNDFILKSTVPVSADKIFDAAVLPSAMVTAVITRPAPFPDFVFSKNNRPPRPVITAEKVSAQHSYDFFTEWVSYAKSVEICRQIGQRSRLLSIQAAHEERIVDAYVQSHQKEIFGYTDEFSRYIWTGGYFDLESHQPYELRWVDHPTPTEASSYRNFCPELGDVHLVIDQALSILKAQTSGASNLNPCDRRWAHVILDFSGHRIGRSCWQILGRDILSADGWKLPFICKR
ncbi:hypothetical protein GHT06_013603 [Daphnia sinensis]|uniref:C-type lectin domain-containing protein n=1 Tax=Daphnia sinensis TaxID=1820382 RepID=A0AAD5LCB0_9CRUS|nr:hypothetical protein GHT06_013603 [Daphnia sinensis]